MGRFLRHSVYSFSRSRYMKEDRKRKTRVILGYWSTQGHLRSRQLPISYLVPFLRHNELFGESRKFFLPYVVYLWRFRLGWINWNFTMIFSTRKNLAPCGMTVDSSWVAVNYSWPWPWPWFGSYGIRSCVTHRPASTYQISLKSDKNVFFWTD